MPFSFTLALAAAAASPAGQIVWTFDRLGWVGGLKAKVEGAPRTIRSPIGNATEFDGVDDALFVGWHPLAGAKTFTFEAVFRPDGGPFEQRWFHLAADATTRILFEVRVVQGGKWYLDAFARGPGYNQALMFPDKLYRTGCWYHVAQVYDGRTYRSYVNGELQGEAEIDFQPQGPGQASVGVRMNRVDYFKGAVREARFTPRALGPSDFHLPPKLLKASRTCSERA